MAPSWPGVIQPESIFNEEVGILLAVEYQSFMRNITTPFLNVLDWIFIFFGSRKRLGDMLASTIVIRSS